MQLPNLAVVQVVDLDHDEEVSITGEHPALYLRHPSYDASSAPPVPGILSNSDRSDRHGESFDLNHLQPVLTFPVFLYVFPLRLAILLLLIEAVLNHWYPVVL
jgi:hypothetical protein